MLTALRRFLAAPTPLATALASVLSTAGLIAGKHLWQPLLLWVMPPEGGALVFTSSADAWLHLALAQVVPAIIAPLAWTVAATRGYMRKNHSGVATLLLCMAPILFGAAAALMGRAMLLRLFWQPALQPVVPIKPMVSIGSLNHWEWAGSIALIISAVQVLIHLQYRETRPQSDPK